MNRDLKEQISDIFILLVALLLFYFFRIEVWNLILSFSSGLNTIVFDYGYNFLYGAIIANWITYLILQLNGFRFDSSYSRFINMNKILKPMLSLLLGLVGFVLMLVLLPWFVSVGLYVLNLINMPITSSSLFGGLESEMVGNITIYIGLVILTFVYGLFKKHTSKPPNKK